MAKLSYEEVPSGLLIRSTLTNQLVVQFEYLLQQIVGSKNGSPMAYEMLSKLSSDLEDQCVDCESFFSNIDDKLIKNLFISQLKWISDHNCANSLDLISLNLTLSCLCDEQFVNQIICETHGPIAIEINEFERATLTTELINNIKKLQRFGHQVWLDDYLPHCQSANATLGVIDWDMIKIDKTYLYTSDNDSVGMQLLIKYLHKYSGQGIIIEGIETNMQRAQFKREGIYLQGFYFGYPQSALRSTHAISNRQKSLVDGFH